MTEELSTAISLMGVGMITVFLVLSFVVIVGNILIKMVNKYVPASEKVDSQRKSGEQISSSKISAIKSAVDSLTGGKGEVIKIERAHK